MKSLLALFALMLSLDSFAQRGGGVGSDKGNGGVSLVCRDLEGSITSAELLDLYEGRLLQGKTFLGDKDLEGALETAAEKLAPHAPFQRMVNESLAHVRANLIFIPKGHELLPTDDALPVIKKKDCAFEQLANFTADGDVLVSLEIYEALDVVNKAALLMHEAVYAARRTLGDQNSQKSRRLVAELMADNTNMKVVARLVSPTAMKQGRWLHDSSFCYLQLSEDGWSMTYIDNPRWGQCLATGEKIHFAATEFKNVLHILETNEYLKVLGPDKIVVGELRAVLKDKGAVLNRVR